MAGKKQTEQGQPETVAQILDRTPVELIEEYHKIGDYVKAEAKRFDEFMAPWRMRQDHIEKTLHAKLLELGGGEGEKARISTDAGTAYLSTIVTPKIVDRDQYLKFCFDNWSTIGNALLQLSAPHKDTFKEFVEQSQGQVPPGTTVSSFTRVNINRG